MWGSNWPPPAFFGLNLESFGVCLNFQSQMSASLYLFADRDYMTYHLVFSKGRVTISLSFTATSVKSLVSFTRCSWLIYRILQLYFCTLSMFTLIIGPIHFKTHNTKATGACCLYFVAVLEESIFSFSNGGSRFFSKNGAMANCKPFNKIVHNKISGNKLSIIRLYFSWHSFFYLL